MKRRHSTKTVDTAMQAPLTPYVETPSPLRRFAPSMTPDRTAKPSSKPLDGGTQQENGKDVDKPSATVAAAAPAQTSAASAVEGAPQQQQQGKEPQQQKQESFKLARQADGSIDKRELEEAVKAACQSLSQSEHSVLWARMSRKVQGIEQIDPARHVLYFQRGRREDEEHLDKLNVPQFG